MCASLTVENLVALRLLAAQGSEPNAAQSGCRVCKGNTASNGTKCEVCVRKTASKDKTTCEDCQWDIANKRGKILVTWGKYFNETQNACAHCPPGKQIYAAAMEKQKSGKITSFNSSNKPCEPCPAGKVKGSAEELCEDCTAVRVTHAPAAFTCKVRCKKLGCSFLKASLLCKI